MLDGWPSDPIYGVTAQEAVLGSEADCPGNVRADTPTLPLVNVMNSPCGGR
jgi:hypothetical protein